MANIIDKIAQIRNAIFGKDIRETMASGIDAINTEVETTTAKQNALGTQFNSLIINAGSSNSEIVAGRTSTFTGRNFDTIGHRIDDVDSQMAAITQQLNDIVTINIKKYISLVVNNDWTNAIKQAITDIGVLKGLIFFPNNATHTYKISSLITIPKGITLEFDYNVIIDCSAVIGLCFKIVDRGCLNNQPVFIGGTFLGNLNAYNTTAIYADLVIYTPAITFIEIGTHDILFSNCGAYGFDTGLTFNTHAYIITFRDCNFRFNNRAIDFDSTLKDDMGEKIIFDNCNISNNNYGVRSDSNHMTFINCSIDYNKIKDIEDNKINKTMRFIDCYLETKISASGTGTRIVNHGNMYITDCKLWDEGDGQIENDGYMCVTNLDTSIVNNNGYLFVGTVSPVVKGFTFKKSPTSLLMFKPELSNVYNNNFENATAIGWITTGTAGLTSEKIHSGTSSMKLATTSMNPGTATSKKIPVGNSTTVFLSMFINKYGSTGTDMIQTLSCYDMDNVLLYTFNINCPTGSATDVFTYISMADFNRLPNNTSYVVIKISTLNSAIGQNCFFDDIYLLMN